MKPFSLGLGLLVCLGVGILGCPSKNNPAVPPAPSSNGSTATWTPSATNTLVNTATATATPTATSALSSTPTPTPTNTVPPGSTATLTPSVTTSPTNTASPTITSTPGPVATYFEGASYSLTGWTDSPTGAVTITPLFLVAGGYGASTDGAGVSVTWSAQSQNVAIWYNYGTSSNWSSLGITGFQAWIIANPLPSDNTGMQLTCESGSGYNWQQSGWNNVGAANTWQQVSYTPPFTATGSDNTNVEGFAFQFDTGGASTAYSTDLLEISNVELY